MSLDAMLTKNDEGGLNDNFEMQQIKIRLAEMEKEVIELKKQGEKGRSSKELAIQCNEAGDIKSTQAGQHMKLHPNSNPESTNEIKKDTDARSIYVGNVDYGVEAEDLAMHFKQCGEVSRVTIPCNYHNHQPKGFAYVEFEQRKSVENAIEFNGSELKGRLLVITRKRTNIPGISSTNRFPRGLGVRGRSSRPPRSYLSERGRGYATRGRHSSFYRPRARASRRGSTSY